MSEPEKRVVQVLSCKCGIQYHACIAANTHSLGWNNSVRACLKKGGSVDTFDMDEKPLRLYSAKCKCGTIKV